jgi:glycerophosphoryl diester phosphodiesterase
VSARPLVVAHRAGNDPASARAAAEAGADLVEADLHMRGGRLELRHPRRLGPVLWDREGIALARGAARDPGPVLAALGPRAEPLLDLKGGPPRLAEAALAAVRAVLGERPVTIASRRWRLLDRLAGAPGVRRLRSAASPREVRALLALAAAGRLGDGACVRADLLAPEVADALRLAAPFLGTWPVADATEAERLAGLGATALIVEDLALVARLAADGVSSARGSPGAG